jgi:hypothetical protein
MVFSKIKGWLRQKILTLLWFPVAILEMAILLKKKLILWIWIWCLPISIPAQSIQFSDSLDMLTRNFYYDIVGLIHGNPLVIRTLPGKRYAELVQFDSACRIRNTRPLYFHVGNC